MSDKIGSKSDPSPPTPLFEEGMRLARELRRCLQRLNVPPAPLSDVGGGITLHDYGISLVWEIEQLVMRVEKEEEKEKKK